MKRGVDAFERWLISSIHWVNKARASGEWTSEGMKTLCAESGVFHSVLRRYQAFIRPKKGRRHARKG